VAESPLDAGAIAGLLGVGEPRAFAVTHVSGLVEARAQLAAGSFDALILDSAGEAEVEAGEGGATLYRELGVPVVLLCEADDEQAALRALRLGAQEALTKRGLAPATLRRAVRGAVERKRSVVELERGWQRAHHLATHDPLTGLPNRQLLFDRLAHGLAAARRYGHRLAVLFLDMDRFKTINDTLGHSAGDLLLRGVGERLERCVRRSDTVARIGGDEFSVVLDPIQQPQDAARAAQAILDRLCLPYKVDGRDLYLAPSLGIAVYPDAGSDPEALLRHADQAMYQAKEEGGGQYQFFAATDHTRVLERLSLEVGLRGALAREEFALYYQPLVSLESGEVTGIEALIRWRHPHRGLIAPDDFIPFAEEIGLIVPIGDWVLRTACAQALAWQRAGLRPVPVAVNLSLRQFRQQGLVPGVARVLREAGLDPALLELEVTESRILEDPAAAFAKLRELKDLGLRIAIDDFGTGHSSLAYLKEIPADTLKIDRSFVQDITGRPRDAAITATIISLGRSLGVRVVAEGVETEEQRTFLRAHRCGEMQGFLFARPGPADDCGRFLGRAPQRGGSMPRERGGAFAGS